MFCPKCGKGNPNESQFCGKCGVDLSSDQYSEILDDTKLSSSANQTGEQTVKHEDVSPITAKKEDAKDEKQNVLKEASPSPIITSIPNITKKWFDNKIIVFILCLFCWPIGLYGLWKNTKISRTVKVVITAVLVILFLLGIIVQIQNPK